MDEREKLLRMKELLRRRIRKLQEKKKEVEAQLLRLDYEDFMRKIKIG